MISELRINCMCFLEQRRRLEYNVLSYSLSLSLSTFVSTIFFVEAMNSRIVSSGTTFFLHQFTHILYHLCNHKYSKYIVGYIIMKPFETDKLLFFFWVRRTTWPQYPTNIDLDMHKSLPSPSYFLSLSLYLPFSRCLYLQPAQLLLCWYSGIMFDDVKTIRIMVNWKNSPKDMYMFSKNAPVPSQFYIIHIKFRIQCFVACTSHQMFIRRDDERNIFFGGSTFKLLNTIMKTLCLPSS